LFRKNARRDLDVSFRFSSHTGTKKKRRGRRNLLRYKNKDMVFTGLPNIPLYNLPGDVEQHQPSQNDRSRGPPLLSFPSKGGVLFRVQKDTHIAFTNDLRFVYTRMPFQWFKQVTPRYFIIQEIPNESAHQNIARNILLVCLPYWGNHMNKGFEAL
jgi:hypothetical protein